MHVLLIEDDVTTSHSIKLTLKASGIECEVVNDGSTGIDAAFSKNYDLILLDIILPDLDGIEVMNSLRQKNLATPVMMLSAITNPEQKIKALKAGADDYLTKPFNNIELVARINAVINRTKKGIKSIVSVGKITIDFEQHIVKVMGKQVKLTDKEYALVELLILRRNKFTTKDAILAHLYEDASEAPPKVINVFICRIRKKLEKASSGLNFIHTVWGSGYKLLEDGEENSSRHELFLKR